MITEENNKFLSFLVWLCLTLFYCYQYILRVLPNIIMPDILVKYSIGAAEFGSFAGLYYIGYIVVHIPVGILLARYGSKRILPLFVGITALGLIPLVYLDSWNSVVLGRFLTGVGSSAAIVGALQAFRIIYPHKFSRMLGYTVLFGLITAVFVGTPLATVIKSIGIESTINYLVITGVVLASMMLIIMPKSVSETSKSDMIGDVKSVIFNIKIIVVSLLAGLMVGPLEGFADAWGSAFMMNVYDLAKDQADSFTLSILFGMGGGCIILPYLADKLRMYLGVTMLSAVMMIACFIHILSGKATQDTLYYACVITGIFCAYQVVIIAKISTYVSEERSGIAAAVANMVIMTFGWVFHNAIGNTMDSKWDGAMENGVKLYTAQNYISSLWIIPKAIFIALVGFAIMIMVNRIHARIQKGAK